MRLLDLSIFHPYESAYRTGERLGDYAYSLCGGPCDGLFVIEGSEMLKDLAVDCIGAEIPCKVLGGMSNILVSDDGFSGIIFLNRKGNITRTETDSDAILLTVDSGVSMASVVRYCRDNELTGFEWAAGLPGTVGGAVYGNAGAFGTEIKDVFRSGELIDETGKVQCVTKEDMEFKYRGSVLKNRSRTGIMLKAVFSLYKGTHEEIISKEESCKERRRNSQPVSERSLGSVFKNPEGRSAGKLIEDAGLKGTSVGKATVSTKHANFITTAAGIRSEDYLRLIRLIQKTVFDKFGVTLEPEVEFLGFEE